MNSITADLRPPQTLRLRLLGEPLLQHARGELPFAPERRFQLLAYLAHQADWVARERLAALFWPDHGAEQARSNLRKVLFRLKSTPGLPPLEEHNGALRWTVATDIQAFEQALAAGDAATALAHWRGDPWQGLGAEDVPGIAPWLANERQRLRARWRDLLLQRSRAEPQPELAVGWARQVLTHDELDEEALGLLVRHALRAGHRVAAVEAYERFRQALHENLGLEPSAATRALLEAPSAAAGPATAAAIATAAADPALIGRDAECLDIRTLLGQPGVQWLTLIGPGGVGKTSLAQQALRRLGPGYAQGGLVVALEDVTDAGPALARLAEAVAAHRGDTLVTHQDAAAQLPRLLQGCRLLLLLDNLEQLRPAARRMHEALADSPGVQVIATSRERLGLPGEQVLAVEGLPWPAAEDADRAASFDAVRLFERQALACEPRFRLADQAMAVVALCEFVEGHPLALQLAAGWTRHLRVSEILQELQAGTLDPAPDATAAAEAAGTRHRSIAAAIDQSWQRLGEAERRLLLRLSVFRGGFTIEAARAVAGASLPALATLIDKSLVRRDEGGGGLAARFSLHPLLLQFAAARHPPQDRRAALQAHLHHYLGLLARFPRGRWAEQPAYYAAIDPELENLRLAWQEAVAGREAAALAQATIGLASHCHARGRCDDGARLLGLAEPVLRADGQALAQLQCSAALLESTRSNYARTAELARQSLRSSRRRGGDARLLRAGLFLLGNALLNQGHYDASFRCYQESLEQARTQGDAHGVAMNLNALAEVAVQTGRPQEAVRLNRQSLDTVAALGLQNIDTLTNLAHAQRLAGQVAEALASFEQARAALDPQTRGTEHTYLAYHHALARMALGDTERAEALVREAIAGLALGGQPMLAIGIGLLQARLAQGRGRLAEARALVREAAADATARRLPPWQLAALLQQAELWLVAGDPGARSRAGAWLRLVHGHPATPFEERQRAGAALARLGEAAGREALPSLDEALATLLAA